MAQELLTSSKEVRAEEASKMSWAEPGIAEVMMGQRAAGVAAWRHTVGALPRLRPTVMTAARAARASVGGLVTAGASMLRGRSALHESRMRLPISNAVVAPQTKGCRLRSCCNVNPG
jgi:hypothetical protein